MAGERGLKYVVLACAAFVAFRAGLNMVGPGPVSGGIFVAGLVTLALVLRRHDQALRAGFWTGVGATVQAAILLGQGMLDGRPAHGWPMAIGYLVAGIGLWVAAGLLARGRRGPCSP